MKKTMHRLVTSALGLCLFLTAASALAQSEAARPASRPKRVLFFTKSSVFEHGVIKEKEGQPSFAGKVMTDLAARHGFELTVTKDGTHLGPDGLKRYDVFVLYTTGDLTQPGADKQPPMPDKHAFLEAIANGKGLVGVHSASDTFPSGNLTKAPTLDDYWREHAVPDPYIQMLGGEFLFHGEQQLGKILCIDSKFPGFEDCKGELLLHEEFYSFKHFTKDMHVLLALATWSVKNTGPNSLYRRAPYPLAWARKHGKGRVFYTALGHREDVWTNPIFQKMLIGGIRWAAGQVNANVKPNVAQVTPGYAEFPPRDPPPEPAKPAPTPPRPAAPTGATLPAAPAAR